MHPRIGATALGWALAFPLGLSAQSPLLTFHVISDVHYGSSTAVNKNFSNALKDLNTLNPKAAALCMVGDLVESSTEANYDAFNKALAAVPHPPTHVVMGNHDVRWLSGGYAEALSRFTRKTGMPGAYFDRWIGGYHFVFLSTDQDLKDAANLGQAQLDWLSATLAAQASYRKPIFVFLHQGLANTTAGTYPADGYGTDYPDGVVQDAQLRAILGRYPQVFFFTGHTHATVETANEVYRAPGFTCVNTAATAYTIGTGGTTEGLCVEVYGDKVVVKGRSFSGKKWTMQTAVPLPSAPTETWLSGSALTLLGADSEETDAEDGQASNAIDGHSDTFWHTAWSTDPVPGLPHELRIDLGASRTVTGLGLLPRQDGGVNGTLAAYEVYVSQDPANWGPARTTGTLGASSGEQVLTMPPAAGRYLRLMARSEINGKPYTSLAELRVRIQ